VSGIGPLNRELGKLDTALRTGRIDRDRFRAERRRLLLEFEERQTTTTPGADASSVTIPGAITPATPEVPSVSVPPRETVTPPPAAKGGRKGVIAVCLAAVVVGALVVGWMMRSSPATPAASATSSPTTPLVANGEAELPQGVATDLMQSQWTEADLNQFLARWQRLPAESVRATGNDPKIWLLRGETDRRLRESREAESVAPSAESQKRVQQLEQVQAALRAP
jgi:hypothetical protein